MVALRKEDISISPENYLAGERLGEERHESLAGVVHAMSGASREPNRVSRNIAGTLRQPLRGKPREAFASDMRGYIQRGAAPFSPNPDIVADCSGKGRAAVAEPAVTFEVISPNTERLDPAEKLHSYQTLPSLRVDASGDQFQRMGF